MATIPVESIAIGVEDRATTPYVQWGPIIAGAVGAAALAFVLHSFASAIGLAVSSTSPTWRDSSAWLWLLSGIYVLLVALASYGLGGYIAGRMHDPLSAGAAADEIDARDGMHGLLAWALATLLTGLMIAAAAPVAAKLAAPSAGAAGPAASVAGENIIAYDLDRLFRTEARPANDNLSYHRAEAARILLTSSSHSGVSPEDRSYLTRMVGQQTGLAPSDVGRRVDSVITSAKENINRARKAGVILAFMAGAAAIVGAVVAWYAALAGGRDRGRGLPFMSHWNIEDDRRRTAIR